jgi:hypothetical protein
MVSVPYEPSGMITVFVITLGASSAIAAGLLSSSLVSMKIGKVPMFLYTESNA